MIEGDNVRIAAVVPAYNEATRIRNTILDLREYVDEIIVIDDASTDETGAIAEDLGAKVIHNETNLGYLGSIKNGFEVANMDVVVTFDADGEFKARDIPRLIKPIQNNEADMVQGNRHFYPRPSEKWLTKLAGIKGPVGDSGTGFRAIKTDLAKKLQLKGRCICGTLALEVLHNGGTIKEVDIELKSVNKPRKAAWYHFFQFFYVLKWLIK